MKLPTANSAALVFSSFAAAWKPTEEENPGNFEKGLAIREPQPITKEMSAAQIAKAYQTTHQRIDYVRKRHGLTNDDFKNPETLFQILLTSRASKLRAQLADPSERRRIIAALNS
jgi:hypothetical protein